ncbi:undecaprenyl-phosphate glucose phosphotransferase [Thalassotalea sp. PS06]|uniref:undecaprenyl-phosphate glucose phosphotransferase n=1 Tax=Thalassotalea sp. PS06 TaxID=2594005 RepID=UPI001161CDFF|nr:undecaprenyl-phosphate glucose phosphotransferase [Thalassotalea sp. PS06]QDP01975.1 undecaprenyl-phosphate glucose phosphotransferase [Thalassotalea sp. PS06]
MKHGILQSHSTLVTFCNHLLDILSIPLSFVLATYLTNQLSFDLRFMLSAAVAAIVFQFIASFRGLYLSMRGESIATEIFKCGKYWLVSFAIGFSCFYALVESSVMYDKAMLFWFFLQLGYFALSRFSLREFLRFMRRKGYNQRNVVIVGAGETGRKLADNIITSPSLGLKVAAFYDDVRTGAMQISGETLEIVGNSQDLIDDAKRVKIDRVYIALSMRHDAFIKKIVAELADTTCSVLFVPDMFSFELLNSRMGHLNGMPIISIYDTPMEGGNRVVKRISDIVLSAIILMLVSPILLLISAAIKWTSPGPVFFRQNRYGMDGKAIQVWKFRSMKIHQNGAIGDNGNKVVQASKGDSRITPLGAFLRRTSLDELPQFINVLQGSMSIVGPRPHAVAHNEEYRQLIDGYMLRHKVKPGITGWAQINGWRGETDTLDKMQKRIDFDLDYINNWSIYWDLKIIVMTIFKGFVNKNAY